MTSPPAALTSLARDVLESARQLGVARAALETAAAGLRSAAHKANSLAAVGGLECSTQSDVYAALARKLAAQVADVDTVAGRLRPFADGAGVVLAEFGDE